MSAFICNNHHISILAAYAVNHRVHGVEGWGHKQIGALLHAENVKSVNHRYGSRSQEVFAFDNSALIKMLKPVAIIKAANCLDYQSCEHEGWKFSRAKVIVEAIISHAITRLEGYEAAAWEIYDYTTHTVEKISA